MNPESIKKIACFLVFVFLISAAGCFSSSAVANRAEPKEPEVSSIIPQATVQRSPNPAATRQKLSPENILGTYILDNRQKNGQGFAKSIEITKSEGENYSVYWLASEYQAGEEEPLRQEWSSGLDSLKGNIMNIQLTGDIAHGHECVVRLTFSPSHVTVKSSQCTQSIKPDGIYKSEKIVQLSDEDAAKTPAETIQSDEPTSRPENPDAEKYYFRGASPKFGDFNYRLEIYPPEKGKIQTALIGSRFEAAGRSKKLIEDWRDGDLKLSGNIAKGVLIGDTSDTGWCEVTLIFSGETVRVKTGKCDLEMPASGVYSKKK